MTELLKEGRGNTTLVDFARKLLVSKNTLNDYELGKRQPSVDFLMKFAGETGITLDDLMTARFIQQLEHTLEQSKARNVLNGLAAVFDDARVPVFDVRFSAGNGGWAGEENVVGHMPVPKKMLRAWGVAPEHAAIVRNAGDSMEPTIGDNDLVLLDRAVQNVEISDMIYAFRLNDELRIKRIRRLPGGGFELRSDNAATYPPEQLPGPNLYDFMILGRVRTVWRNLP